MSRSQQMRDALLAADCVEDVENLVKSVPGGVRGMRPGDLVRVLRTLSDVTQGNRDSGAVMQGDSADKLMYIAKTLATVSAERARSGAFVRSATIATILSCLGSMRVDANLDTPHGPVGKLLGDSLMKRPDFEELGGATLANAFVSLVRSNYLHPGLCSAALKEVERHPADFTSSQLANVAWALATAGHGSPATMRMVAATVLERRDADRLTLSKLGHAFAKAECDAPELFSYVAETVVASGEEFQPRQLSTLAWAFSKAGYQAPEAPYAAIAKHLAERMDQIPAESLSISLWAFGHAGFRSEEFLEASKAAVLAMIDELTPQGLTDAACAYVRLDSASPEVMEAVQAAATARVLQMKDGELANLLWAYATAEIEAPKLFAAVQAHAASRAPEFRPQHLATVAWASARAGHQSSSCLAAFAEQLERRADELNPRELANVAWAYAVAAGEASGVSRDPLFGALEAAALSKAAEFDPVAISSTLYALARVRHRSSGRLFRELEGRAVLLREEFGPQAVANTLYAYARLGHKAPLLFDAMAGMLVNTCGVAGLTPQEVSNIAWSYAKLGHSSPELLYMLADRAAEKAADFTPQGIANMMWAMAKAQVSRPSVMVALTRQVLRRMGDFSQQELCNVLWAATQLEFRDPVLFGEAEGYLIPRQHDFDPVTLTITLQAYAKAGFPASQLCDAAEHAVAGHAGRFSPRDLSSIAWSFAKLKERSFSMFRAIAKHAARDAASWDAKHLAQLMWACGRLRHSFPGLLDAVEASLEARRGEFSPQALSNVAQAYAQLGVQADGAFGVIYSEVLGRQSGSFKKKELSSIQWSFQKFGLGDDEFFTYIAEQQQLRRQRHEDANRDRR